MRNGNKWKEMRIGDKEKRSSFVFFVLVSVLLYFALLLPLYF